ncbi:MAG TPA: ABC transporter substrate-binding protein [Acidimicrobiales bacterium]
MSTNKVKVAMAAGLLSTVIAGVSMTSGAGAATKKVNWATVTSAQAGGGMTALVKAAKKEGHVNVITIPLAGWANYGLIMKDFTKKYGIKINDANPNGSSAQEITAIQQDKGRADAPDVVDVGTTYATGNLALWAPYKVANWSQIPASAKDAKGRWFDDYGGYVAIGCDTKIVTTCPTSFKDLSNPIYKNEVAINNDPTSASAAFYAVWAASIANGGSFSNVQPGIDFFANLNKIGNFVPGGTAATAAAGTTPILIWWDYLQNGVATSVPGWKSVIPTDGTIAAYYTQAITKDSPDPAAARLWEEFLYSSLGQNLFLQGYARPIELAAMTSNKTVNPGFLAKLPAAPKGALTLPTIAQVTTATSTVDANWAAAISGS